MTGDRDELRRLVEELPEDQVPTALAEVRQHLRSAPSKTWPPPWFAAATARRTDTAARAEELLAEGFGQ